MAILRSILLTIMVLSLPLATLTTPVEAVAVVTGIAPTSGPAGGGTVATITGTDFLPGTCTPAEITPFTTVIFDPGGVPAAATGVTVVNETTITAVTPLHAPGTMAFSVNQGATPCGGSSTTVVGPVTFTFIAQPATVTRTPTATITHTPTSTPVPITPTGTATPSGPGVLAHFVGDGDFASVSWSNGSINGFLQVWRTSSRGTTSTFLSYSVFSSSCCPFTVESGNGIIPNEDLRVDGQLGWGGGQGTATLHTDTSAAANPGFARFGGSGGLINVVWEKTFDMQSAFNGTSQSRFGNLRLTSNGRSENSSALAAGTVVGSSVDSGGGFFAASVGENRQNSVTIQTGRQMAAKRDRLSGSRTINGRPLRWVVEVTVLAVCGCPPFEPEKWKTESEGPPAIAPS